MQSKDMNVEQNRNYMYKLYMTKHACHNDVQLSAYHVVVVREMTYLYHVGVVREMTCHARVVREAERHPVITCLQLKLDA